MIKLKTSSKIKAASIILGLLAYAVGGLSELVAIKETKEEAIDALIDEFSN